MPRAVLVQKLRPQVLCHVVVEREAVLKTAVHRATRPPSSPHWAGGRRADLRIDEVRQVALLVDVELGARDDRDHLRGLGYGDRLEAIDGRGHEPVRVRELVDA
eukprot:294303-Pyramimonas_sp.AAC.1